MSDIESQGVIGRDVAYAYSGHHQILNGVDIDVKPGNLLAILGRNGSGKSTLLSCLNGLLGIQAGTVLLNGKDLQGIDRQSRAQQMAYVTQHSHAHGSIVYDALLLGRKPYLQGAPRDEDYAIVDEVIAEFGLEELALRNIHELSGGEYQKMIIARAFVQQPDILLLDEPTNNLDLANQIEVLKIVRRAVDEKGIAAATVLHDINLALSWCDSFVFLKEGKVLCCGDQSIVTQCLISEVYGVEAKIITHEGRKLVVI